jgi:hypothetical protein
MKRLFTLRHQSAPHRTTNDFFADKQEAKKQRDERNKQDKTTPANGWFVTFGPDHDHVIYGAAH